MKGRVQLRQLGILAVFGLMAAAFGCASTQSAPPVQQAPPAQNIQEKPAPVQLPPQAAAGPALVPYYPPPNSIDLCGERVPLNDPEVYERFDREFTLVVYNHAQVYLWLKRMERYFPWIEEKLRQDNLPQDLKYVAIAESDLLPNAISPKGAAGPWQFMPSTGSAYGLEQRGSVDKRYDFERSTESAFLYLQDIYRRQKSWSLAMAGYNCGERRVQDEMRSQGVRDYYHLKLPQETERYVFRILAIKAVLGNPGKYGYDLPRECGYQELKLDRLSVTSSHPVAIQTIAGAAGISYRQFKTMNPIYRSDDLPAGTHEIKLPAGTGRTFQQNFRSGSVQLLQCP